MRKLLTLLLLPLAFNTAEAKQAYLKVYPAPAGAPLNDDYTLLVRNADGDAWLQVPTYLWRVDDASTGKHRVMQTSVASFDFEGTVEMAVVSRRNRVETCRVRPLSYGIEPQVSGDTIRFAIDRPRYLSVEVNGDIFGNLQIFANAPAPEVKWKVESGERRENSIVDGRDAGRNESISLSTLHSPLSSPDSSFVYFGPGYYDLGDDSIAVKSGQTVYIDGGAYIKGWMSVYKADNVRVIGHGIVNPDRQHEGIMVRYSRNVTIDGPFTTQIPVGGSDSVTVRNAKVMSWYGWGDGMNVFASNNVSYDHVFCRTSDDCSTIYCTRKDYRGGCRNITVHDAVYWADVAHPIMIGLHGDTGKNEIVEDVLYDDIDILENPEHQIDYKGCIGINDGDNNLVRRVTFNNIRIESLSRGGMLFNFRVCYNKKYCAAPGRGIEDITLRDISYNGVKPDMSIITGYSSDRLVRNIRFENLRINGKVIADDMPDRLPWYKTSDYANIFVGEHVENVTFNK